MNAYYYVVKKNKCERPDDYIPNYLGPLRRALKGTDLPVAETGTHIMHHLRLIKRFEAHMARRIQFETLSSLQPNTP